MIRLQARPSISLMNCAVRTFSTCTHLSEKYASRQAKMMQKIMTGSLRRKKNWFQSDYMSNTLVVPSDKIFHKGSQSKKRVAVLNKLLMSYITDLMATGEVSQALVGYGITVSRIKVSSDFSCVNVYWLARGTEDDNEIEKLLEGASRTLRHELTQLHILGVVPKIKFVKDKQLALTEEVIQYLKKADMGDKSEDPVEYLKSQPCIVAPLPPDIKEVIKHIEMKETEGKEEKQEEEEAEDLPPMTHDVLGLHHDEIMTRLEKDVKKSRAVHRFSDESTDGISSNMLVENQRSKSQNIYRNDKSAVALFVRNQKILKKKQKKFEMYQEEREIEEFIENDQVELETGGDYIDEDIDVEISNKYKE